jgi:hypothetical protein
MRMEGARNLWRSARPADLVVSTACRLSRGRILLRCALQPRSPRRVSPVSGGLSEILGLVGPRLQRMRAKFVPSGEFYFRQGDP